MVKIDHSNIVAIKKRDVIIKGIPEEIKKENYTQAWTVRTNFLIVHEIDCIRDFGGVKGNRKFSYASLLSDGWYILEPFDLVQIRKIRE